MIYSMGKPLDRIKETEQIISLLIDSL